MTLQHSANPSSLLLLAVLTVCSGEVRAGDNNKRDTLTAKHFPMQVGHNWVYTWEKKEVTFAVLRTEKDRGTTVFVVRRTFDKTSVEFRVAVEEDGVYIHQEGKKVFSPPLRQFAFFPRKGDIWKWSGTFGGKKRADQYEHLGTDKITVPAGTFETVSIYRSGDDGFATFWLAPGVGVVMLSGKVEGVADDRLNFEWKLKRFQPGTK
jgi:hypothetical protein